MSAEIREYLRAYWVAGRKSYSQGKAIWAGVLTLASGLGLTGLSRIIPQVPVWLGPACIAAYVIGAVFIYWPYRMWKLQRAEIAQLTLPQGPIPDMPIAELFDLVGHDDPEKGMTQVGLAILDKLSTGQLNGWGRTQEVRVGTPFVPIERGYWAIAGWTYNFLAEKKDSLADDVHVWPRLSTGQHLYDVHVNRAQALRIWRRAKKP